MAKNCIKAKFAEMSVIACYNPAKNRIFKK